MQESVRWTLAGGGGGGTGGAGGGGGGGGPPPEMGAVETGGSCVLECDLVEGARGEIGGEAGVTVERVLLPLEGEVVAETDGAPASAAAPAVLTEAVAVELGRVTDATVLALTTVRRGDTVRCTAADDLRCAELALARGDTIGLLAPEPSSSSLSSAGACGGVRMSCSMAGMVAATSCRNSRARFLSFNCGHTRKQGAISTTRRPAASCSCWPAAVSVSYRLHLGQGEIGLREDRELEEVADGRRRGVGRRLEDALEHLVEWLRARGRNGRDASRSRGRLYEA